MHLFKLDYATYMWAMQYLKFALSSLSRPIDQCSLRSILRQVVPTYVNSLEVKNSQEMILILEITQQ